MEKTIVVYYSLTGFTKKIAEIISDLLGGKVLRLKPVKDISDKGFMKYFWGGKQVMMKEAPKLESFDSDSSDGSDFSKYDTLVIGTPVWAFTFTPALRSFLETVKLANKKIILFCTHEGQPGKTLENMEKFLGKNNQILMKKDFNRKSYDGKDDILKKDIQELLKEI